MTTTATDHAPSDRQLVDAVTAGSDVALETICARYQTRLHAYIHRLVPQAPVDEITQDVFAGFWAAAARYDPERGSLNGYLHVIARSRALDWLRSETARRQRQDDYARLGGDYGDRTYRNDVLEIREAVESLPLRQRQVVWLAYYLGFSYRQVAAILNIPEGTAKANLRSALRQLQIFLVCDDEPAEKSGIG
jgi:RNA polymerase sigma-70 factor (ECF subfamily)